MTTVVDASALLGLAGPRHRVVSRTLGEGPLAAPELIDLELAHALRRHARMRVRDAAQARAVLLQLSRHPRLQRYEHLPLISRVWELRENLTAYDASYVALAEKLSSPLVTFDARLARAASRYCETIVPAN